MNEPRWLTLHDIEDIHAEQLALFGGPAGIRDRGALESALGRPINRWHYENADMAQLAAAYAFGIARNHPFVDGNKRVGHAAMVSFLRLNGRRIEATVDEAEQAILQVASGILDRAVLQAWIEAHEVPRS